MKNIKEIKISDIVIKLSPRKVDKRRKVYRDLVKSIREVGLIYPITVTIRVDNKYELIDGMLRCMILEDLGHKNIKAMIV